MMQLVDTHCHIHEAQYELVGDEAVRAAWLRAHKPDPTDMIDRAAKAGVTRLICVGTSAADSTLAVNFVQGRANCWASVGLHPHEAKDGKPAFDTLQQLLSGNAATSSSKNKIAAIGECGLDYFYSHSPKKDQVKALRFQIELAQQYNLPLIFHVRSAFDDFWPLFDSYTNLRGVLHSFTDSQQNLDKALARNLYIGANGIMTFTKDNEQHDMIKVVPLQKLLLETDAPFLTPVPFRGKVNEPVHVVQVAKFLAALRNETIKEFATQTTNNAHTLFNLTQTA